MALRRLACSLTATLPVLLALLAGTAAQQQPQIQSSNSSTALSSFTGTLQLQSSDGTRNLSTLVPLTRDALVRNNSPLTGNLFYATEDTINNVTSEDIGYISCNALDYHGMLGAMDVLKTAMNQHNLTAVILYSTASEYCGILGTPELLQEFPIFSMSKGSDSATILNQVNKPTSDTKFPVAIRGFGVNDASGRNGSQSQPQQQNPLGPSPSTAVAMIILYSITGIITALFLVIIVTGAIRAHRHPDRYGPRDMLGRPRQSRARGLGRAILDTIPIVKFGEREEPPKPADIELGSTAEARNVEGAGTEGQTQAEAQSGEAATETHAVERTEASGDPAAEHSSGTVAAQSSAAGAVAAAAAEETASPNPDEGLGCSICTDDFEKGQDIRVLPCNHKFHPECVDPWLLNVSGTCPLCRVDLRPRTSHDSAADPDGDLDDPDGLAPPLQPDMDPAHRRRSGLRDILSFRQRPNASSEERISALRRLRELHRNQSGELASGSANESSEDVAAARRRSRRISARLSGVFNSGRITRRYGQEEPALPMADPFNAQHHASRPAAAAAAAADAPVPASSSTPNAEDDNDPQHRVTPEEDHARRT